MLPESLKIFHIIFTSTISFFKKYPIQSILATAGLMFFVYGLISLSASNKEDSIVFEDTTTGENQTLLDNTKKSTAEIVIDIEGSVMKPGVYRLNANARIKDALIAASGLSSDADREWVAKTLNLAQKLTDGAKVYIPKIGEGIKSTSVTTSTTGSVGQESLININTASLSELDSLSGVGQVTAQKIVDNRPYTDVAELLSKKVVGSAVFEKIKEKITVY